MWAAWGAAVEGNIAAWSSEVTGLWGLLHYLKASIAKAACLAIVLLLSTLFEPGSNYHRVFMVSCYQRKICHGKPTFSTSCWVDLPPMPLLGRAKAATVKPRLMSSLTTNLHMAGGASFSQ